MSPSLTSLSCLCELRNVTNSNTHYPARPVLRCTRLSRANFLHVLRLLDNRRRLDDLLTQNMALDEVRQPDLDLVSNELLRRDREDLVQLFKRELLSLPYKAEDHEPGDQVECSVEANCRCCQQVTVRKGLNKVDLHAPVGVMTSCIRGKVKLRIPAVGRTCQ